MSGTPTPRPPARQADPALDQQLREMNEALLVSSVKLHELAEKAEKAEALVRATEHALAKALVYTDDIISTLREPFLVLDQDLRVKTANRSFYESFHVSKEETENRLVYDLGNGQWDIPALRKLLDEVLSRNQSVHDFEVEHSFPTVGRKIMLLNARPFSPESKHPELILLAVEDVSAKRHRADELADMDRRKDEFLAMLSHELRSPLAPISNAVQLLGLDTASESRVHQQARNIIERQLRQLQHLVDDLLEVSRITTGRVQLRSERVAVSDIANGAVETVRPLIEQRRHEITVSLPPEPIWLNADAARLEQVVVNLLTNAAKYTEEGGHLWLTVEVVSGTALAAGSSPGNIDATTPAASALPLTVSAMGCECLIRVRDNGVGIDPALLPRIFDLFTQAERSLDRSQGGLGIGLALVQRLTELHGGTVEAHSTLGQGSEFVVRLPIAPSDESQSQTPAPEIGQSTTRPLRVLVVDDNVDTVLSFSMLLEAHGHEMRTAYDGLEAVQTALEYQPDIMLLDIGLPGLNGYQVAKQIRQEPSLKHIVLVALTGYGQDSDRQTSLEAGFNHHMVKPAVLEQLLQILATVSEQRT